MRFSLQRLFYTNSSGPRGTSHTPTACAQPVIILTKLQRIESTIESAIEHSVETTVGATIGPTTKFKIESTIE